MTPDGKGWGLRTLEDLPRGAFICEYVGEVLTNAELFDRVSQSPNREEHSYPVLLDADWGSEGVLKDEDALCLDATFFGNVARFINHRYAYLVGSHVLTVFLLIFSPNLFFLLGVSFAPICIYLLVFLGAIRVVL